MPNFNHDELPGTPSPGLSPPQRCGRGLGAALRRGRSGGILLLILLLRRCWGHGGRAEQRTEVRRACALGYVTNSFSIQNAV